MVERCETANPPRSCCEPTAKASTLGAQCAPTACWTPPTPLGHAAATCAKQGKDVMNPNDFVRSISSPPGGSNSHSGALHKRSLAIASSGPDRGGR